jgi:lysophospholipase L1-like esterase
MRIKPGERLVFFGDSLTMRTDLKCAQYPALHYSLDYAESYVDILVKRLLIHAPQLEFTFYNRGNAGDTIRHLLERYAEEVLPLHPDWMFLWVGQNDAKNWDCEGFEQGVRCLLEWCRQDGIKVLVLSTSAHRDKQKMIALAQADAVLKKLSEEFGCDYVDVKTPMLTVMEHNRVAVYPIQLFTLGSHLSELGNMLIADTVFDYLQTH